MSPAGQIARIRPIVLVHAFGSSSRAWSAQVAGLGADRAVVAEDLPGHGSAAGPFTLDRAVESTRDALDEAGGVGHVVGISGGAIVALLTCLAHPSQVSGLVLSGMANRLRALQTWRWWHVTHEASARVLIDDRADPGPAAAELERPRR